MKKMPVYLASLSLALVASVTGCSSSGGGNTAASPSAASPTSPSVVQSAMPSASPSTASSASATTSAQTVDPNTATTDQLAAALRSAGVNNPEKWADEVKEYGPYTAENLKPTLTKELGKYDISQDQLNRVLSALKVG